MEIKILGNGGAINNGLFYNSFIIDNHILCETPPDIMLTLKKQKVNIVNIDTIIISHFHGDHIFGFPFLILNLFYESFFNDVSKIDVYGPKGIKKKVEELWISAFTKNHPCFQWIDKNFIFHEISNQMISINDYKMEFYELDHIVLTYGFNLYEENDKCLFSYVADSIWTNNINLMLNKKPKVVIIDLNGKKEDNHKIHISIDDLIENGLVLTGDDTIYYGTHLKDEFESHHKNIKCSFVGSTINI